jgi:hypothetical protein
MKGPALAAPEMSSLDNRHTSRVEDPLLPVDSSWSATGIACEFHQKPVLPLLHCRDTGFSFHAQFAPGPIKIVMRCGVPRLMLTYRLNEEVKEPSDYASEHCPP